MDVQARWPKIGRPNGLLNSLWYFTESFLGLRGDSPVAYIVEMLCYRAFERNYDDWLGEE